MNLERVVDYVIQEDTLETVIGEDDLLMIFRIDADELGKYWEVLITDTDTDKTLERHLFRDEASATAYFEKEHSSF